MSDSARRTVRTVVALALGALPGLPLLVHTAGLPSTLPGLGTVLAVAAAITRVLALPQVDAWLPAWMRMAPPTPPLLAPTVLPPAAPPTASRE